MRTKITAFVEMQSGETRVGRPDGNYNANDAAQAECAFGLVAEMGKDRESDFRYIAKIRYFLHDFNANLGGTYGGLAGKREAWIRPVFLMVCRAIQAAVTEGKVGNEWCQDMLGAVGADNANETLASQLQAVLEGRQEYFLSDTVWFRRNQRA